MLVCGVDGGSGEEAVSGQVQRQQEGRGVWREWSFQVPTSEQHARELDSGAGPAWRQRWEPLLCRFRSNQGRCVNVGRGLVLGKWTF